MARSSNLSREAAWAHLRFAVVGPLLSSPPARGRLKSALRALAEKSWRHPATGGEVRFAAATIERWYYKALRERHDPVGVLRRRTRRDAGRQCSVGQRLKEKILQQHARYGHWTYKLHYDNLRSLLKRDPSVGPLPSYPSVVRFMKTHGLLRKPRPKNAEPAGLERARARLESREVRSYEAEYVGSLWHLDFHHSSLKVLSPEGEWVRPVVLGILDDRSRIACHLQWYLSESAENLVHGLSQAILKRGLPRSLLTDNGAAMLSEEVKEGLLRLGVIHETTLAYSPYQNGKQESFWARLEGRLMAMLAGVEELTLDFLNRATQAWVEVEYNRTDHSETSEPPLDRFTKGPSVSRPSPDVDRLRCAFRLQTTRSQRRSDGTVSLEGVRFEIPGRFRNLGRLTIQYARWDLRSVHLVDERDGTLLAPIYPLDRAQNADARRRILPGGAVAKRPEEPLQPAKDLPALLKEILRDYSCTGIPPAYLPKTERKENKA
jgi:putative transposase